MTEHDRATVLSAELTVIAGLDAWINPVPDNQCQRSKSAKAARTAFAIYRRETPYTATEQQRIYDLLRVSALAYLGGSENELREWYDDNDLVQSFSVPPVKNDWWDRRVLLTNCACWIRLFRQEGVGRIPTLIDDLVKDQSKYERGCLLRDDRRAMAYRLIALYQWSSATKELAEYLLDPQLPFPADIDRHFQSAIETAVMDLEVVLWYLYAVSKQMLKAKNESLSSQNAVL